MNVTWLESYLHGAIDRNLCTKIFCTTCGANDFRNGLRRGLGTNENRTISHGLTRNDTLEIATALGQLIQPDVSLFSHESALRCIIFDLWTAQPDFHSEIEKVLGNSWAGHVLQLMKAHHLQLMQARAVARDYASPVSALARRLEIKISKQTAHLRRLELKSERDKEWRDSKKQL